MKKKTIVAVIVFLLVLCLGFCIYKIGEEQKQNFIDSNDVQKDEVITLIPYDETKVEVESFEEKNPDFVAGALGNTRLDIGDRTNYYVYYNQTDSRWGNIMYSSVGNRSQTIGSSGCGPTSSAMVVSTIKGIVTPDKMAKWYVDNGFRSPNNGTYFSAYEYTANYFDIPFKRVYSTFDMADSIRDENYIYIVSCSEGLFTTGGHYIVVYGRDGDTLKVYDPYLYSGKFDSSSRRGKLTLNGNTAYISVSNFKAYANAKAFFGFKNTNDLINKDSGGTTPVIPTPTPAPSGYNYTGYVNTNSLNLNVRNNPNCNVVGSLSKGTIVTIVNDNSDWFQISSPMSGWVSKDYIRLSTTPEVQPQPSVDNTVGKYYRFKYATNLYSNSDLTGTKYNYLAQTQVKVIKNVSANIDYVYVVKTGRYGYVDNSVYKGSSSNTQTRYNNGTVGKYYRFKYATNLYSNSNLTGTKYNYLAQTQVKVIKNISSTVDYVYVVKTGRYGYVNNNVYR